MHEGGKDGGAEVTESDQDLALPSQWLVQAVLPGRNLGNGCGTVVSTRNPRYWNFFYCFSSTSSLNSQCQFLMVGEAVR